MWQDDPSKETPDQEARAALARLAADFGTALAKSSGCGSTDAPDMHLTAPGPAVTPATDGQLCGLPGVGTGRNLTELAQRVSDPAAPLQSCWVYSQIMSEPALRFTVTTDTRYPTFVAAGRAWTPRCRPVGEERARTARCTHSAGRTTSSSTCPDGPTSSLPSRMPSALRCSPPG